MVLPTILALVLALGVLLYLRDSSTPRGLDRLYIAMAPAPLALSVLIPMFLGGLWGFGPEAKWWIDRFSWSGVGLSVGLAVVGVVLIVLAVRRGREWGRLSAATVLAASPSAMVIVSFTLLWALEKIWR